MDTDNQKFGPLHQDSSHTIQFAPLAEDSEQTANSTTIDVTQTNDTGENQITFLDRQIEGQDASPQEKHTVKDGFALSQYPLEETAHNLSASALEAALHEVSAEEANFIPTLSVVSEFQSSNHRTLKIEDLAASAKPKTPSPPAEQLSVYPLEESQFTNGTANFSLSQGPLLDETEGSTLASSLGHGVIHSQGGTELYEPDSQVLSSYPLEDATKSSITVDHSLSHHPLNSLSVASESQDIPTRSSYTNAGLSVYALGENTASFSHNTVTDSDTTHSTIIQTADHRYSGVAPSDGQIYSPVSSEEISSVSHSLKENITILSPAQRQELFYSLPIDDTTMTSKVDSTMNRLSLSSQLESSVIDSVTNLSNSVRSDPDSLVKSSRDHLASSTGSVHSAPGAYSSTEDFDRSRDHGSLLRPRSFDKESDNIPDFECKSDASADSGLDNLSDRLNAIMSEAPITKRKEMAQSLEPKEGDHLDPDVQQMLEKPRPAVTMPESPGSDASGLTNHSRASTEYHELPSKITSDAQMVAIPEALVDKKDMKTPSQKHLIQDSADDSPGVSSDVEAILRKYDKIDKSKLGAIPKHTTDEDPNSRDRPNSRSASSSETFDNTKQNNDALGDRVRHLLEEKAYSHIKGEEWGGTSRLDYSGVAKDLDEIQSHLSAMRKEDASFQSSSSITSQKTDQDEEKKKYSWDYGADIGYNDEGRFVSSTGQSNSYNSRLGPEGQTSKPPVNIQPLLTSDIVPLDVALDIMQATEEAIERGEFDKTGRKLDSEDADRRISEGTLTGSDTTVEPLTTQDLSTSFKSHTPSADLSRSRSHISKVSDQDGTSGELSRSRSYISRHSEHDSSSGYKLQTNEEDLTENDTRERSGRDDSQLSTDYKYRSVSASPAVSRYTLANHDPSFRDSPKPGSHYRSRSVDPNLSSPRQARVTSPQRSPVRSQAATTTLSDRVYNILTNSSPHRQAYRYLQEAEEKEANMEMEKINRRSTKIKSTYISPDKYDKFNVHSHQPHSPLKNQYDTRYRDDSFRTLSPDRTRDPLSFGSSKHGAQSHPGITPVSYKPFSAFNQVEDFLAKQMDNMADTTFDRSMDIEPKKIRDAHLESERWATPRKIGASPTERFGPVDSYISQGTTYRQSQDYGAGASYRPSDPYHPQVKATDTDMTKHKVEKSVENVDTTKKTKYKTPQIRPYKPPGSQEVYYIESDGGSVANSETTVESTHQGSDDARPPLFPSEALGSRQECPADSTGIYSKKSTNKGATDIDVLSTIHENSHAEKSLGESTHSKNSKNSNGSSKEQSLKKTEEWLNGSVSTSQTTIPATGTYSQVTSTMSSTVSGTAQQAASRLPVTTEVRKSPYGESSRYNLYDRYTPGTRSRDTTSYQSTKSDFTGTHSTITGHPRVSDIRSPHDTDFGRKPRNTNDGGFATSSPAYSSSYVEKSLTPTSSRVEQREVFSPLVPDQDEDASHGSAYFHSSNQASVDPVIGLPNKYQFPDGSKVIRSPNARRSTSPSRISESSPERNMDQRDFYTKSPLMQEKTLDSSTKDATNHSANDSVGRTPYRRRVELKRMIDDTDTSSDSHQTPLRHSPPARHTRRTPEQKPAPPIPSNVNQLWQKFKASTASDGEENVVSPKPNHEDLIKLLSNPVHYFIQQYQRELRGEKAKPKETKDTTKASTAWSIPAPGSEKRSPERKDRSGTAWDIPVDDNEITNGDAHEGIMKGEPVNDLSARSNRGKSDKVTTTASVQTTFSHEDVPDEKKENTSVANEYTSTTTLTKDSVRPRKDSTSSKHGSQGAEARSDEDERKSQKGYSKDTIGDDVKEQNSLETSALNGSSHINSVSRQSVQSVEDAKKEALKLALIKKFIERETQTSDKENSLNKSGHSERRKKKKISKSKGQTTQTSKSETEKVDSSTSMSQGSLAPQGVDNKKDGKIPTLVGQEDTLLSIPEDSTLESSGFTSSSVESDGVLLATKKRNLPNDPKLIKLYRKIQRQKEKYLRDKLREQARKDKIALLEKLLKEKGKKVRDNNSQSETSTTTTFSSIELQTHLSTPYRHNVEDSTDSDTLTSTPSQSYSRQYASKSPNRTTDTTKSSVCICKPHSPGKIPKQKKSKVNNAIKLKLQEVDYSRNELDDSEYIPKFQSPKKHKPQVAKHKSRSPKLVKSKAKKMKDFGNTYPSPMVKDKRKYGTIMVSEGIQTMPEERLLAAKPREDQGVVSVPQLQTKAYNYNAENRDPKPKTKVDKVGSGKITWFIPVEDSRPWRRPLSERQDLELMLHHNDQSLQDDGIETGRLDSEPEFHMSKPRFNMLNLAERPPHKVSLQDAFKNKKKSFISKSRERQRYVILRAQERRIQAVHSNERLHLFADQRRKKANPDAHPLSMLSGNLHLPKRRFMSKKEMKKITDKMYKKLPEVVEMDKLRKRTEQYTTNRLKAKLFKQKVLDKVLYKKPFILNP